MEISVFQLYVLMKLDAVGCLLRVSGTAILIIICIVAITIEKSKPFLWPAILGFLLIVTATLLPTTKEACALIVVPRIINNQQVHEIPSKLLDLGVAWEEELKSQKNRRVK